MKKKIILKNGEYAELLQFVVVSNIVHAVVKTNDNRIDVVHHRDIIFPEMVEVDIEFKKGDLVEMKEHKKNIFIKKVTGRRKDNGEYVEGSLMYDLDQDCWRIIEYSFDIEEPKLDSQFGVCAYEIYLDMVEECL